MLIFFSQSCFTVLLGVCVTLHLPTKLFFLGTNVIMATQEFNEVFEFSNTKITAATEEYV